MGGFCCVLLIYYERRPQGVLGGDGLVKVRLDGWGLAKHAVLSFRVTELSFRATELGIFLRN